MDSRRSLDWGEIERFWRRSQTAAKAAELCPFPVEGVIRLKMDRFV
jgi:hypothetical protein